MRSVLLSAFIDHFDPASGAPPLAWLTLTLKRHCWAARAGRTSTAAPAKRPRRTRQDGASPRRLDPLPYTGPEQLVELIDDARTGLAALKPAERRALSLIAAGFAYAEIGAMNEWTYSKTNRCAAEGRAALRSS